MTRFLNKSLSELMEVSHDSFGSSDGAVVRKSFVVGLDEPQVVEIIDHEPGGVAQAFARGIAEEVQSLQPGHFENPQAGLSLPRAGKTSTS
jgi:hypothetical protein